MVSWSAPKIRVRTGAPAHWEKGVGDSWSCPMGRDDMRLGEGLQGSKNWILSPSSHGKRVKHAIDMLCLGDFHIKKAPFRISTPCQIGLLVKFSCATQNCQSPKLHGKCPWHRPGVRAVLRELIVWLSAFQCRPCFHGETHSIGPGTLQRRAETWQGAGGLLNLVASFLFVLIWKQNCRGHLETRRELVLSSGDCALPGKHLRYSLGLVAWVACERDSVSPSRASQGHLWTNLSRVALDWREDILQCFSLPCGIWWISKRPFPSWTGDRLGRGVSHLVFFFFF